MPDAFGRHLVRRGVLREDELLLWLEALATQTPSPVGVAVSLGYLGVPQAISVQEAMLQGARFEDEVREGFYLTATELVEVLAERDRRTPTLQAVLVAAGRLDAEAAQALQDELDEVLPPPIQLFGRPA